MGMHFGLLVQMSEGVNFSAKNFLKKFLSNLQKWVCILIPLVQISRGIKFFQKNPDFLLSRFKQVRGILNPFTRTLTTEYPLPSGDTTPRPLCERIRRQKQTGINGHTEERLKNFNENQRRNLTWKNYKLSSIPSALVSRQDAQVADD